MSAIVADSSAILALLLREPFRNFDPDQLFGAIISAVNVSEVLAKLISIGTPADVAAASVASLDLDVRPFDEPQAHETASLILLTRSAGLSLGDCACLALASALDLPVVTADRAWSRVGLPLQISLIR